MTSMSALALSPKVGAFGANTNSLHRIFKDLNESGLDQTQLLFEQTGCGTNHMSFDSRNSETKWTSHMSNPQAISRNLGLGMTQSVLSKPAFSGKFKD